MAASKSSPQARVFSDPSLIEAIFRAAQRSPHYSSTTTTPSPTRLVDLWTTNIDQSLMGSCFRRNVELVTPEPLAVMMANMQLVCRTAATVPHVTTTITYNNTQQKEVDLEHAKTPREKVFALLRFAHATDVESLNARIDHLVGGAARTMGLLLRQLTYDDIAITRSDGFTIAEVAMLLFARERVEALVTAPSADETSGDAERTTRREIFYASVLAHIRDGASSSSASARFQSLWRSAASDVMVNFSQLKFPSMKEMTKSPDLVEIYTSLTKPPGTNDDNLPAVLPNPRSTRTLQAVLAGLSTLEDAISNEMA